MKIKSESFPVSRRLLGVLVLSAGALASYNGYAGAEEPPIPPGAPIASWYVNGQGGRYLLQVAEGRAPAAGERIVGAVTSDTNCEADAQGLSHCNNAIELENGGRITVIDTHQMMRNRCLSPGDRISMTGISGSWVMGTLSGG